MNAPTTDQTRLVIVGATGMVGGYALGYALEHAAVGTVTAIGRIGRKKLGISHRKLYHDFITLGNAENGLKGNPPGFVVPTFKNDGSTAPPIFSYRTKNTYP
jgi:hypothetical protein